MKSILSVLILAAVLPFSAMADEKEPLPTGMSFTAQRAFDYQGLVYRVDRWITANKETLTVRRCMEVVDRLNSGPFQVKLAVRCHSELKTRSDFRSCVIAGLDRGGLIRSGFHGSSVYDCTELITNDPYLKCEAQRRMSHLYFQTHCTSEGVQEDCTRINYDESNRDPGNFECPALPRPVPELVELLGNI